MKLRDYQVEGKKDIYAAWQETSCVFFVLATGGGKTVTFVEIIRDFIYQGVDALLLAHREELITQAHKTLYRNKIMAGIIKAKEPYTPDLRCQVGSVQTMARRDLSKIKPPGVIVIDEGHHVTEDNTYGKILATFPFAKVLIVSATPYRLSGEGFENIMPNNKTKLVISRTLPQLIKEAYLVPLRYFLAQIPDLSQIAVKKGDYNEEEARKVMKLAPLVDSYEEHASGKSFICFAINVQHSKDICSAFWNRGIPCAHLDADTPAEERKQILEQFKAGFLKGIINVGILTEGTDFPNLECIILGRPTKSLSLFLQMVGRGTRALEGLLDGLETIEARQIAIAMSAKPYCIVLDNASLFNDHGMPDGEFPWHLHFKGMKYENTKKAEIEDEIEIEIYEVEDANGVRTKTANIKEIEGMRLVEVTHEIRRKIINIQSLKKFEKEYETAKNIPQIKKPGYVALLNYITYCTKQNFLMVPEVWDYLEQKLIKNGEFQKNKILENQQRMPGVYTPEMLDKALKRIESQMVSKNFFKEKRQQYAKDNADQLANYLANKVINNN